jgi:hypothetical protein
MPVSERQYYNTKLVYKTSSAESSKYILLHEKLVWMLCQIKKVNIWITLLEIMSKQYASLHKKIQKPVKFK